MILTLLNKISEPIYQPKSPLNIVCVVYCITAFATAIASLTLLRPPTEPTLWVIL